MSDAKLQFEIHPSSGIPIYRQLMDQVKALIASRRLATGDLLPSIRQLSADLEVNMMTVSKAYARLEAEGFLERVRGTGMRVKPSRLQPSVAARQRELRPQIEALLLRAAQLNLNSAQVMAAVRQLLQEQMTWQN